MNNPSLVRAAAVLGLALILAASVGAYTFYRVRSLDNTLSVTGSAMATTTADTAKMQAQVMRTALESDVASVQARVSRDAESVAAFFRDAGIPAEKVRLSPVFVDREYRSDAGPQRYNVRQEISIESNDTALVDRLSKDVGDLTARGILVTAYPPQYFISSLPELRVALIGKAVADAKRRAEEIAKSTGQAVGRLQSASGGVVQVMAPNSIEISDYGSYDTSTIEKQVMVTARALFYVR